MSRSRRLRRGLVRLGLGAAVLQTPEACSNLDLLASPLTPLNPCNFLNCDPSEYRNLVFLLNSEVTPRDFCTVPFFCGDQQTSLPPIGGGGGGALP